MFNASFRFACVLALLLAVGQTLRAQTSELPTLLLQEVSELHSTVLGSTYELRGDPAPARLLARMYAAGKGVPRDEIAACALAIMAQGASVMRRMAAGEDLATYNRLLSEAEAFRATMCGGLSPDEQSLASTSVGCLAVGMPEEIVQLGTALVRIGRAGIGVLDAPAHEGLGLPNCPFIVSRARTVSVLPSPIFSGSGGARHFVEVIYWNGTTTEGGRFGLHLLLFELRNRNVEFATMEPLKESSAWPNAPVDIRTHYEMQPDGRIRFEVDGEVRKRGWVDRLDR